MIWNEEEECLPLLPKSKWVHPRTPPSLAVSLQNQNSHLFTLPPFNDTEPALWPWPGFHSSFIPSSKSKCFPKVKWINKWVQKATAEQSKHPWDKQTAFQTIDHITSDYDLLGQDSQPGAILLPFQEDIWECLETVLLVAIWRMLLASRE